MKTLLIVFSISVVLPLCAQNVPNGDFEKWHSVGGWFDNPDDWQTNNTQIIAAGVVQDMETPYGLLAMQVRNVSGIPGNAYTMFQRVVHPLAVNVSVKTDIVSDDSVAIRILIYHSGSVVDSGVWYGTTSEPWTQKTIEVSQNSDDSDSMEVRVTAGKLFGSWLSVDQFDIEDLSVIDNIDKNLSWTLFPNPMRDHSELSFENTTQQPATVYVRNLLGEIVLMHKNITDNTVLLERNDFTPGLFLITLMIDGKEEAIARLLVL